MRNVLPNFDLNSHARRPSARRHPERSRFLGEARDLPQNSSDLTASAAKPATKSKSATDHWPLATANWTNP